MGIGDNVKARREELGLTQKELAERCGVGKSYIADIEAGRRNLDGMTYRSVKRIARALDCKCEELDTSYPVAVAYLADRIISIDELEQNLARDPAAEWEQRKDELVKLCGGEVEAKDYLYGTLDEYRQFTRILLDEDGTFCRIDKDGNYID